MAGFSKSTDYPRSNTNTAFLVAEMNDYYPVPTTLITDNKGVLRDPCISWDADKIVFAWSKDNNGYHIFDLQVSDPATTQRQLTTDLGTIPVSDFEPCILPNNDILFGSSRCFGHVDCNINITSNLYMINKDGKYLRHIGYDQVHTFYPTIMDDGTVVYGRWEYNDRNVMDCFGIFVMNPDGSHQTELFGNQTSWPATFPQNRQIPGTSKIMSVIGGHYGPYAGDLVIIDPTIARNGAKAVQLIAPKRENPTTTFMASNSGVDSTRKLFQDPYPLDDTWFLISWRPIIKDNFKIVFMNVDGEHELIAWDDANSVSQPLVFAPRKRPIIPSYQADYTKKTGIVTMTNAYNGTGTGTNVKAGTIKKIRVISLEYRTDPAMGHTGKSGYQMTPLGRYNCSWESKRIVGEAPVESDGSAAFIVPALRPLYVQLIDDKGQMVNTMRSWMTLMPGEKFACFGCHEDKNAAPPAAGTPIASNPVEMQPFHDIKDDYLYYPKHIQPILDEHCVKSECHEASHSSLVLIGDKLWSNDLPDSNNNVAFRYWCTSYWNLTGSNQKYVKFNAIGGMAAGVAANRQGSVVSDLPKRLRSGHNSVSLSTMEMDKICAWIDLTVPHSGTYWDDLPAEEQPKYLARLERRQKEEAFEATNIEAFIAAGGYKGPDYATAIGMGTMDLADKSNTVAFSARFSARHQQLIITLPSEGIVTVMDLNGRKMASLKVSASSCLNGNPVIIPNKFSSGIYIVDFKGLAGSLQRTISKL